MLFLDSYNLILHLKCNVKQISQENNIAHLSDFTTMNSKYLQTNNLILSYFFFDNFLSSKL